MREQVWQASGTRNGRATPEWCSSGGGYGARADQNQTGGLGFGSDTWCKQWLTGAALLRRARPPSWAWRRGRGRARSHEKPVRLRPRPNLGGQDGQ